MRPTDENQAASTRPNLMSSRRGAGEENILAMLERDSARRPGTRMSGARLASYGAAAALAGILAGGVAWLAYDNHKTAQQLQFRYDAIAAAPAAVADAALPPPVAPGAAPAPAVEAARTAVIVDESARTRDTTLASAPPPLVMLPQKELKNTKPPASGPRPAQDKAQSTPMKAQVRASVKSDPPRMAARPALDKKAAKTVKPAARAARPAATRVAGTPKARPEAAARQRKGAAPAADAPVDSDVALISAIIAHSERHRGEPEPAGACSGARCQPKSTRP